MLRNRILAEWAAIVLLAVLVIALSVFGRVTERFDNLFYDTLSGLHAAAPSDKLIIVEIDNDSQTQLGRWPWDRSLHAQAITALNQAGAKAIAYDVLFLEPGSRQGDRELADAMRSKAPVVLPLLIQSPGLNGAEADILRPVDPIGSAATAQGIVDLSFDDDGIIRHMSLSRTVGGVETRHLMDVLHQAANGTPSPAYIRWQAAPPYARDAGVMVPFAGLGAFRHISIASIIKDEVPVDFLKDKIVLIGATASGMGDRYPVSGLDGAMPGVEIQANMLNALIADRLIAPLGNWGWLLASLLPPLLLMIGFLRLKPTTNLVSSLSMLMLVALVSAALLVGPGLWFPPGPALLALIIIYPLWGWRRLEALSSFVARQSQLLTRETEHKAPASQLGGFDRIAAEAEQLGSVIGDLSSMRRFMSDIIEGFPDAIFVVDEFGKVSLANAAADRLTNGASEGIAVGRLLEAIFPDFDAANMEEADLPDGRSFLVRRVALATDARQHGGEIVRLADITHFKEATREREELLQFLSHDMRAPQAAIISTIEMHLGKAKPDGIFAKITSFARHTLDLADDFVQLARLRSVKIDDSVVDLTTVVTEAVDIAWPIARKKQIRLEATGGDDEVLIRGDEGALVRALSNLIGNAVKYCPPQSWVECALQVEPATLPEECDWAICRIIDNGPGLPADRAANMFTRFGARGDTEESGAGLGLAFVKGVVDHHGGTITVESVPGAGTSFIIRLPVVDDADQPA